MRSEMQNCARVAVFGIVTENSIKNCYRKILYLYIYIYHIYIYIYHIYIYTYIYIYIYIYVYILYKEFIFWKFK